MQFRLFLEALHTPPHMLAQYFNAHKEAFAKATKAFEHDKKFWNLRWFANKDEFTDAVSDLDHIQNILKRGEFVYWISSALESQDAQRINRFLKATINHSLSTALENWTDRTAVLQTIMSAMREEKEHWDADDYGDYETQMAKMQELLISCRRITKMQEWYPEFVKAVETTIASRQRIMDRDENLPAHAPTETLYHATTNVPAIMSQGFKTRRQLGDQGALGGGPDDVISFTADLRIAEAIVWAIRRAIEIAQGKLTLERLETLAKKWNVNWQDIMNYGNGSHGNYSRLQTPMEQRQWVFSVFRYFMMEQSRVYNPVFSHVTVHNFVNLNPKNVGILAADVDMSQIPNHNYLPSMEEYRVPVGAIQKVWPIKYSTVFKPPVG